MNEEQRLVKKRGDRKVDRKVGTPMSHCAKSDGVLTFQRNFCSSKWTLIPFILALFLRPHFDRLSSFFRLDQRTRIGVADIPLIAEIIYIDR